MLDRCFDLGIEWVDTSPVYNHGVSESWIADWEQHSNRRFKVATKAGKFYKSDGRLQVSNKLEDLTKCIKESLTRLKRDKLELLFLHDFEYGISREKIRDTLKTLLESSLVQKLGLSNFPSDVFEYLINRGCISCLQVSCLASDREAQVSAAVDNGIECWLYRPFNKGNIIKKESRNAEEVITDLLQKYPDCKILFGASKLDQLEWIKKIR